MPIVYFQELISKAPIGIPIPDITPLNPPLGLVPPLPPQIVSLDDTAQLSPLGALMAGLAYAGQHSDSVFGTGSLDVARYGRLLKSRQLVGVRGAGLPFDGLYYVKSVTHDIKRGEYKQSFTLARNGAGVDRCRRCRYERWTASTASTAARCVNNIDPMQIGRIQAMVPDVGGLPAVELGDAVRAGRRHQHGPVHGAADRRRRLDRVRARRPRLSDLGRRLLGQRRRDAGARARRCRRGSPASRCRRR